MASAYIISQVFLQAKEIELVESARNCIQFGTLSHMILAATIYATIATTMTDSPVRVEDLSFMTGSWTCQVWGGTFEETWIAPKGGAMQGVGRHLVGDKVGFMESMSIETATDGTVTMYIVTEALSKASKNADAFKLTSLVNRSATFERIDDDFPTKITYKATKEGGLFCRIEGIQKGKPRATNFEFMRNGTSSR